MAIDYSKMAFISTLGYMRIFNDYTIAAGGGSISHNLGYVPYFIVFALESVQNTLIPIQSGNNAFPAGDFPNYIINATTSAISVTENAPPTNSTSYFIRVYEDPLP